jgi:enamine deaminase RidA (YjgF/YER057c/UK114 family)
MSECYREYGSLFLTEAAYNQSFLVASVSHPGESLPLATQVYNDIADEIQETGRAIVHERVFGSLSVEQAVMTARQKAFQSRGVPSDTPVTYIQGGPPWGEGFAGVLLRMVSQVGGPCTILASGNLAGRKWRVGELSFIILQNVHARDPKMSRPLQARHMIEQAEALLRQESASYSDVVRTWFYLSHILDWYGEFNEARNARYTEMGLMPHRGIGRLLLPASTGIRGEMSQGSAGVLDLLALVGPEGSKPRVRQLTNVGQEDAFRYGSAFSRGALICGPDVSMIEVSGTAAIDEHGETVHSGKPRAQIECTLDKIASLLEPEGARLEDIASATVFVKRAEDISVYQDVVKQRGLDIPAVSVVADVCRDDLLFEMDGVAAFKTSSAGTS